MGGRIGFGMAKYAPERINALLLVGEDDARYPAVRECAKYLAQATLVALPGLTHIESFVRSDLALPHVIRFLEGVRP